MCKSVPQIVEVSTRTIASVGSMIVGSSTESHPRWPGPWYTRAFIAGACFRFVDVTTGGNHPSRRASTCSKLDPTERYGIRISPQHLCAHLRSELRPPTTLIFHSVSAGEHGSDLSC